MTIPTPPERPVVTVNPGVVYAILAIVIVILVIQLIGLFT